MLEASCFLLAALISHLGCLHQLHLVKQSAIGGAHQRRSSAPGFAGIALQADHCLLWQNEYFICSGYPLLSIYNSPCA